MATTNIIDFVSGRSDESHDKESIQEVIEQLLHALDEAYKIREKLKE